MNAREYAHEYGAGTSLLLRLSEPWRGSGRLIVVDSTFASVKSAVTLKTKNGLYFHGLVKTAHHRFPKKYLNEVKIDTRGGHVVIETTDQGVDLRAVTWNDGKKDKKTGLIVCENCVASCGTTLSATDHRKCRWRIGSDGRSEDYFVTVSRPQIVQEYFDGVVKIDIHNHFRQGRKGVVLEQRRTMRWDIRFYQTVLDMIEVDSYLNYRRFCPHRSERFGWDGVNERGFPQAPTLQVWDAKQGHRGRSQQYYPGVVVPVRAKSLRVWYSYFIGKIVTAKSAGKP